MRPKFNNEFPNRQFATGEISAHFAKGGLKGDSFASYLPKL